MKKNINKDYVMIGLLGLIFILVGLFVYLSFFSDYGNYKDVNNFSELSTVFEEKLDKYGVENVAKLERNVVDLNNLTNKEKVDIAYYGIRENIENSYENGIDVKLMDDYLKDLFGPDFKWKKESILCNLGHEMYIYSEDKNKYEYNEEHYGHGGSGVESYFSKIVSIKQSGNLFKVTGVRLWLAYSDQGPNSIEDAYDTYDNALQEINKLFNITVTGIIPEGEQSYYYLKTEIENNFDQYKDKMATYTYTFEKVDGEYYLVGLSFEDR